MEGSNQSIILIEDKKSQLLGQFKNRNPPTDRETEIKSNLNSQGKRKMEPRNETRPSTGAHDEDAGIERRLIRIARNGNGTAQSTPKRAGKLKPDPIVPLLALSNQIKRGRKGREG